MVIVFGDWRSGQTLFKSMKILTKFSNSDLFMLFYFVLQMSARMFKRRRLLNGLIHNSPRLLLFFIRKFLVECIFYFHLSPECVLNFQVNHPAVTDLFYDLRDGVKLLVLLEILTGRELVSLIS